MKKKTSLFFFLLVMISFMASAQLSWLQMPDFPGGIRSGVASFSLNNKGYMGLGNDQNSTYHTDWYEYDPAGNTWTQKASLPGVGRGYCVSFSIGSKGYVISGEIGASRTNEVYEYDPSSDSWTAKAAMPGSGRMNAAGFSLNGLGYVGTGYIGGSSLNDFYEFNPVADTWTAKASFPGVARDGASGFSAGSKGYIGMGNTTNGVSYPNDFYEYDPSVDSWSAKAGFPLPWVNAQTTYSANNTGYVMCGYFYQSINITHNPMNMVYKYDTSTDSWILCGTFPGLPRGYSGGFALTNDIYLGAGSQTNSGNPKLTDFWKLSNGLTLLVENIHGLNDFAISPNPSQNRIYIGDIKGKHPYHIRIYDIGGKLINQQAIIDNHQPIDISSYRSGLYFIELITKEGDVLDSRFVRE